MPSHLDNPWNHAVTYLETQYGDHGLACGSGFFWRNDERTFLVSNWHNFSGRNSETSKPIRADGGLPDRVNSRSFRSCQHPMRMGFSK